MLKTFILVGSLVLAGLTAIPRVLFAQSTEHKLTASDSTGGFGYSVSVSGDVAVVGADFDNHRTGAAYVFRWNGNVWEEEQKLMASDAASHGFFGFSVSISGDVVLVGAWGDNDNGKYSGAAYIFRDVSGAWEEEQKLTASDGALLDVFGISVSVSGDVAVVGAYRDDDSGPDTGSAYVFRWNGEDWIEEHELLASDRDLADQLGWSVSVAGNVAVAGAHFDDDNGSNSGSAYVFRWNGVTWEEEQKLIASDGSAWDQFGQSVSVYDDIVVVGASGDDEYSGSVYVFRWNGMKWQEEQKLIASDGVEGDQFGHSVSVSGNVLLVGARSEDDNGSGSGSAYVFRWNGVMWVEEQKLVASDGAELDGFGTTVSMSGNVALVGAPGDYDKRTGGGSAYVYEGITVDIEEPVDDLPAQAVLAAAYPNPSSDQTTIEFVVPERSHVALRIYDLLGREVRVLCAREMAAGKHEVAFDAGRLAPGVYVLRLEAGSSIATQRLTVIR
ncbi:MAG: T9SS type A sorting domain-containing protein [Bacteroidetes bacterium]|nr:T9SS type A sorting domain-containing protein [Bacteroidota bacterium]